jgi:hypothetical protein
MAYRPRRLKQAKSPMSEVAWRYFMAPRGTCDDYEESRSKSAAEEGAARDDFLGLYYLNDWKEYWRGHRAAIEAEWVRRFPNPEERAAHRRWALQSFSDRLRDRLTAERDNAFR